MKNDTKKIAMTGGAVSAEALRQINPDVMPIYPITPQTPIIFNFAKIQAKGLVDTEIITVESEHSAMSACIGSSAAGARTVTATSSQGMALMNEMLYIASGMNLPIMMLVSARALSAPLNIHCDHSDVMGARDTGWAQIFCENVQEVYDNTIIGMKLAEKTNVPVMVIMDGFITSHSIENVEILSDEFVKKIVGEYQPEDYLLNIKKPLTLGPVGMPNSYFEFKIAQAEFMQNIFSEYKNIAFEFEKISGRFHDFFEGYRTEDADSIIVLAGSTAGTAKEAVDKLRGLGKKVGILKIKLFRPFPHDEIGYILSHAKNVAVLDRAMSIGTFPPLYSEIINSLNQIKSYKLKPASYIYGLGGRDIFQKDIEKVFEDLEKKGYNKGKINYIA
jgi:pyruvate ferredoxin oxidoreductase alpha subunit